MKSRQWILLCLALFKNVRSLQTRDSLEKENRCKELELFSKNFY
jgi:hypothetical protein